MKTGYKTRPAAAAFGTTVVPNFAPTAQQILSAGIPVVPQSNWILSGMTDPTAHDLGLTCEQVQSAPAADLIAGTQQYMMSKGASAAVAKGTDTPDGVATQQRIATYVERLKFDCLMQTVTTNLVNALRSAQESAAQVPALQAQVASLQAQLATCGPGSADHVASIESALATTRSELQGARDALAKAGITPLMLGGGALAAGLGVYFLMRQRKA